MGKKERYEWGYNGKFLKYYILDTQTKDELGYEEVFDLLNQQDKKIKKLREKNRQLKQSQKQLAIEKLEKVKKCIHSYVRKRNKECAVGYYNEIPKYRFDEIIENQIKSLKGENNK